jgi:hypothetical protein
MTFLQREKGGVWLSDRYVDPRYGIYNFDIKFADIQLLE